MCNAPSEALFLWETMSIDTESDGECMVVHLSTKELYWLYIVLYRLCSQGSAMCISPCVTNSSHLSTALLSHFIVQFLSNVAVIGYCTLINPPLSILNHARKMKE